MNATFEQLTEDLLVRVANSLHLYDVLALGAVSKRYRRIVQHRFFSQLRQLVYYSVERPLTVISAQRLGQEHAMQQLGPSQIAFLLRQCGSALHELDLNVWRWMVRSQCAEQLQLRNYSMSDWAICRTVAESSQALVEPFKYVHARAPIYLHTMDLSFVPLSGQSLLHICSSIGASLKILRLYSCFYDECDPTVKLVRQIYDLNSDAEYDKPAIMEYEFSGALEHIPNLVELQVGGNDHCFGALSFAGLSPTLRSFKAFGTYLSVDQLAVIVQAAPQLRELHLQLFKEYNRAVQLVTNALRHINSFWLYCAGGIWTEETAHSALPQQKQLQQPCTLKSLRICDHSGQMPAMWPLSSGAAFGVSLEELCISGGNTFIQPLQPASFFTGMFAGHLTRLHLCCHSGPLINDQALEIIAKFGQIEELRIILCKYVSWRGFAVFLQHCPNVRLFEGFEQLTDQLLDAVMEFMDGIHNSEEGGRRNYFLFVRFRPELLINADVLHRYLELLSSINQGTQSRSQNMHPWVQFAEQKRDPVFEWPRFWPQSSIL